jgi:hypothetical protein
LFCSSQSKTSEQYARSGSGTALGRRNGRRLLVLIFVVVLVIIISPIVLVLVIPLKLDRRHIDLFGPNSKF